MPARGHQGLLEHSVHLTIDHSSKLLTVIKSKSSLDLAIKLQQIYRPKKNQKLKHTETVMRINYKQPVGSKIK